MSVLVKRVKCLALLVSLLNVDCSVSEGSLLVGPTGGGMATMKAIGGPVVGKVSGSAVS